MDELFDFEAPEFLSDEDEQFINELFSQIPNEPELHEMNARSHAIHMFLYDHKEQQIFMAQMEAIKHLQGGGRFN